MVSGDVPTLGRSRSACSVIEYTRPKGLYGHVYLTLACSTSHTQECDQGRSWVTGYSAGPVRRLGLVRDENPCQLLHNTIVLVLAHPMEHCVEVRCSSHGILLRHAVIVLTERGGQNSSKDKLPETGGRHGRRWSFCHGGPRFIVQCLVCSVAEDDSGIFHLAQWRSGGGGRVNRGETTRRRRYTGLQRALSYLREVDG